MKMNIDLVREILLDIQEKDTGKGYNRAPEIDGYTVDEIRFHCKLMGDDGLIRYRPYMGHKFAVVDMTAQGHRFLSLSSNNSVWNKTKKTLLEKGISFSIDQATRLLNKYSDEIFGS